MWGNGVKVATGFPTKMSVLATLQTKATSLATDSSLQNIEGHSKAGVLISLPLPVAGLGLLD